MKGSHVVAVVAAALIASGGARGADLDASLGVSVEFDDNVGRLEGGREPDVIFVITPRMFIFDDDGKASWQLDYSFPYERAVKNSDRIDNFRHFVNASGDYQLTDRLRLFSSDVFSYTEALDTIRSDNPSVPVLSTSREPVLRNRFVLGSQYRFTPRLVGNLAFTHRLFQSDIPDRANNQSFVGNTNLRYALSVRHQVGGGVSTTYQDFQRSNNDFRPPSEGIFVNFFGIYTWTIDETASFEITAGPTYVENRPEGSSSVRDWTIFGAASLEKQWSPNLRSVATYTRQDSTASGLASSAILDLVTFQTQWRISERLRASVRADFAQRDSVDKRDLVDAFDSTRWGAGARIQYFWTRQLSTALRYAYNFQRTDRAGFSSADNFQNNIVALGVQYDFDQWHLW